MTQVVSFSCVALPLVFASPPPDIYGMCSYFNLGEGVLPVRYMILEICCIGPDLDFHFFRRVRGSLIGVELVVDESLVLLPVL